MKEIVDSYQINRNTFTTISTTFLNFWNMPIKKDADEVIESYSKLGSPIVYITPLLQHCMRRKKTLLYIFRSTHREIFLNELDRIILGTVTHYIEVVPADLSARPEDKKLLIIFYKCTLVGATIDWLDNSDKYDLAATSVMK